MKIGLVLDDTLDTPDGVQQYVLAVGSWMQAHGHEVHYLVGETKRTDIANLHSLSRNVHVTFNGNKMSMPLPASRKRLKKLLTEQQFDILHVQVPYSPFMAGRLLKLAPASTAIVGTFHILPYSRFERLANAMLALLNRRTGRRFQAMIAASAPAADFANQCYGFDARVIPHPFNYQKFNVPAGASSTTNIVYMARLVERKGAAWLLRAVSELKARNALTSDVRVIVGGRGPLLEDLQKYAERTNISEYVSFTGFVPEDHKAEFLAQADIGVFPSTAGESFGISIIEALAAVRGVVLAGDNPGYRSAMHTEAQVHDPTDTKKYAELLEYWLGHPEERKKASGVQKAYAQQFDTDTICAQVQEVYNQALQTRTHS